MDNNNNNMHLNYHQGQNSIQDQNQSSHDHHFFQDHTNNMVFEDFLTPSAWPSDLSPAPQYQQQQQQQQNSHPVSTNDYLTARYQNNPPATYNYDIPQQADYSSNVRYVNSPYSNHSPFHQPSVSMNTDFNQSSLNHFDPPLSNPTADTSSLHAHNSYLYPLQPNRMSISPSQSFYTNNMSQFNDIDRAASGSPYQRPSSGATNPQLQTAPQVTNSYYNSKPQYGHISPNSGSHVQYATIPNGTSVASLQRNTHPVVEIPSYNHHQSMQSNVPQNAQHGVLQTSQRSVHQGAQNNAPQASQQNAPPQAPRLYDAHPISTEVAHAETPAQKDNNLDNLSNPYVPYGVFMVQPEQQPHPPLAAAPPPAGANPAAAPVPAATTKPKKASKAKKDADGVKVPAKRGRPRKNPITTGYKGTGRPPKTKTTTPKAPRPDGSLDKPSAEPSSSEEETSSDDESEYEDDPMPVVDISTVRPLARPADPVQAAGWDAVGIVWKDPYQVPSQEVVSDAVAKYGQFVIGFRNQIKAISTKIDENGISTAEIEKLKVEQTSLLDILYQIVHAAVNLGSPVIVERLGNHHQLVNALISTLRDCIKTSDYNGTLPKEILTLLAKFTTMSDDILKKCKFDGVQKRWVKKGDAETNRLFNAIIANTVEGQERAAAAKKSEEVKKKSDEEKKRREAFELAKQQNAEALKAAANNSLKRPLEGDISGGKPAKKLASDATGAPAPIKANIIKKPTGNLLGISARPVVRPVVKRREPSPPQESRLGALLASIAKPTELPKKVSTPPRAPETPAEKARRERKESRRHLRVKFKDGPELEEIRLFKHEQEEDEGRQSDMLRDAADTHNEGMMHKKRTTEAMDEGLDDDEYQPPEVVEPTFSGPKPIDFSLLEKNTRYGPTFTTRGGDQAVSTPEQKAQQRREAMELMVIYTDANDVPPSAKEPAMVEPGSNDQSQRDLKHPSTPWLVQRIKDIYQYGPDQAFRMFSARAPEQNVSAEHALRSAQPFQVNSPASNNVSRSLATQSKTRSITTEDLENGEYFKALNNAYQVLKDQPFPPTQPPSWMIDLNLRAIWTEGYNRDKAVLEQAEAEKRLLAQMQAQPPAPAPPVPFNPFPAPNSSQFAPPLLQHGTPPPPVQLAGLRGFQNYPNDNQQSATSSQFEYNAWLAGNANPLQQPGAQDGNSSSRQQDFDRPRRDDDNQSYPKKKKEKWQPFNEKGEYQGAKLPCRYFPLGKCMKGAACTYLH